MERNMKKGMSDILYSLSLAGMTIVEAAITSTHSTYFASSFSSLSLFAASELTFRGSSSHFYLLWLAAFILLLYSDAIIGGRKHTA